MGKLELIEAIFTYLLVFFYSQCVCCWGLGRNGWINFRHLNQCKNSKWALAQMVHPPLEKRARWRVRSWVQGSPGACVVTNFLKTQKQKSLPKNLLVPWLNGWYSIFVALTSSADFLANSIEMYKFDAAANILFHVYSCKHAKFLQGRRNVWIPSYGMHVQALWCLCLLLEVVWSIFHRVTASRLVQQSNTVEVY